MLAAALVEKGRATPADWSAALDGIVAGDEASRIAASLSAGESGAVLLGIVTMLIAQYSMILALK